MALKINNKFNIGDIVYLLSDDDQLKYQVIQIVITINGHNYVLQHASESSEHYEFEITSDRQVI